MIAHNYAHAHASSPIEHSRPRSIEFIPIAFASINLHRKRRLGFPVVGSKYKTNCKLALGFIGIATQWAASTAQLL